MGLQKPRPLFKTDMGGLVMVMSVYELQAVCHTPKGIVYQNCQFHDPSGFVIGDDHIQNSVKLHYFF